MTRNTQTITKDNFWETDLEHIESTFLKKGKSVTDLPICLSNSAPPRDVILPIDETQQGK